MPTARSTCPTTRLANPNLEPWEWGVHAWIPAALTTTLRSPRQVPESSRPTRPTRPRTPFPAGSSRAAPTHPGLGFPPATSASWPPHAGTATTTAGFRPTRPSNGRPKMPIHRAEAREVDTVRFEERLHPTLQTRLR